MAAYSLSSNAAIDIAGIYEYTIITFGLVQARKYLSGLHDCFQMLADSPLYGRNATDLAPNLRRLEYRSHVVFYVPQERGVPVRIKQKKFVASAEFSRETRNLMVFDVETVS